MRALRKVVLGHFGKRRQTYLIIQFSPICAQYIIATFVVTWAVLMQETHWPKSHGFEFHKGCAVIVSDFVSLNRSYHLSQLFCAIPEMVRPQYLFLFDLVHQKQ